MRLKEILFIVCCFFSIVALAEEKQIEEYAAGWHGRGARSLPSIPVLSHDGNILYVYSDVPLENLQIQVKDASGSVVHMENVSIDGRQKYFFVLELVSAGSYVIELLCGEKYLYGSFEL